MSWHILAAFWLLFANLAGFILMAWDKRQARAGGWRVAESTFILWSLAGGAHGIFAAQRILRHKSKKQPISSILIILMLLLSSLYLMLCLRLMSFPLPG